MAKALTVDIEQRVNTCAILEAREPRTAGESRLLCKLLDKISLTPDEQKACGYAATKVGPIGMEQIVFNWDAEKTFETTIDLEDAEFDKLKEIFSGHVPGVRVGMRKWH